MKKIMLILVMIMTMAMGVIAQETKVESKKVYDESINTMTQIDDAIKTAKTEGKYVICQVGGNWCPWCLKFAKFITEDAEIKEFITNNFVYIHVNYPSRKGDRESAAETMKRLGNPQRFGFPVMVVLNEEGKVLHYQDSSFLEEGSGYNKDKVMRFFKNWTREAVTETK